MCHIQIELLFLTAPKIFVIPSASYDSFRTRWFARCMHKCVCVLCAWSCLPFLVLFDYVVCSVPLNVNWGEKTGQNDETAQKIMRIKKRTLHMNAYIFAHLQHWCWCVCVRACVHAFSMHPEEIVIYQKECSALCVGVCVFLGILIIFYLFGFIASYTIITL